jgi:hypothetical protein
MFPIFITMRDFKFLTNVDENDAVEPNYDVYRQLMDNHFRTVVDFNRTSPPQTYTQMLSINVPINDMTEDYMNELKLRQERILIDNLMDDVFDFRHEVISVDENGFTLRTELFI